VARWDVTSDDLASFVIATVGRSFAARVRDVFAIDDEGTRLSMTAAWYWATSPQHWSRIDRVPALTRFDELRALTVEGLVRAIGPAAEVPHVTRPNREPRLPGDPPRGSRARVAVASL
jgi:hypothetical protein